MTPKISVIIPVYNSENTIIQALESITNQTFGNFEIIIVNDGSEDSSEALIKQFGNSNDSADITYVYKKNTGVSSTRNVGLKMAQGEYIAFLDSDDCWEPDKTKLQFQCMDENPQIDLIGTNRDGIILTSVLNWKIKPLNRIDPRMLMYKNYYMTSSVIFKREIIDDIGYFNEEMNHSEDWEFFLRISNKFECYLLNQSLVRSITGKAIYGDHGLSADLWKMEKGELHNLTLGYKMGIVSFFELIFLYFYSVLKFIRRLIISYYKRSYKK